MKKTLLIAAIALVITAGTVSLVDAQMKNKDNMNRPELTEEMKTEMEEHQAKMEAQREKMNKIMENGTYEEWKALIDSRPRMTDYITAENFARFQEAHQLKIAGDHEAAKKIMEELGIEGKMGFRQRPGKGFNQEKGASCLMDGNCPCQK